MFPVRTAVPAPHFRACLLLLLAVSLHGHAAERALDFNRDVRPILSENCFRCHGFDEKARKARLRLDTPEGAMHPAKSGAVAVVPFKPADSELVKRITSTEPDDLMPPEKSDKKLSAAQIETLRRWVAEGAKYARHWAFEPPVPVAPPAVRQKDWPLNDIDPFVLQRLEREGLQPSPEAGPARWLRRVSLDLTGLPPTPEEVRRFEKEIQDTKIQDGKIQDARSEGRSSGSYILKSCILKSSTLQSSVYSRWADKLLESPHFGERLALDWLDTARYADTNGYFGDHPRQVWAWRDWVIEAFNRNLPFDQFTIEQLAGDLLPNPTRDQLVATGFQRNCMSNNESGIIDEEYRVEYVIDRLNTAAATWMGVTVGCAQCHDHKYDPLTQKEFYQMFAFFNSTSDTGLITKDSPPPTIEVPTPEQQAEVERLGVALKAAEQGVAPLAAGLQKSMAEWEKTALPGLAPLPANPLAFYDFNDHLGDAKGLGTTIAFVPGINGSAIKLDATQHVEAALPSWNADGPWSVAVWLKPEGPLSCVWSKIGPVEPRRGVEVIWQKGRLQVNLVHQWSVNAIEAVTRNAVTDKAWHQAIVSYDGSGKAAGLQVLLDGQPVSLTINRDTLGGTIGNAEPLRIGRRDAGMGFHGLLDEFRVLSRVTSPGEAAAWFESERVRGVLATASAKRGQEEQALLRSYYLRHHAQPPLRAAYERLAQAKEREQAARAAISLALVMQDLPHPRDTHVLLRGQYDHPGDAVEPGVPAVFPAMPADAPRNRLGFARWLVGPGNPLTARVAVNRLWQMCFGEGLVRTPNDFGTQGEPPTHPELLDALALRFVSSGWDVKAMLRLIVLSATYRQSSAASAELMQRDPENRLLARGPRFRLPAELIRDQALAVSGLLSPRVGGPSSRPWQPPGLWEAVSYNGEETYVPDSGDGLWRRSLYTYWKRQAPPPALMSFDAPTREKCTVRRARTNTPLQALVLLNDDTCVIAARALASRTLQGTGTDDDRLRTMFQRVTSRLPEPRELALLQGLIERQRDLFNKDKGAAEKLLGVGDLSFGATSGPIELAAWANVAQTLLNLDEAIVRR